MAVPAFRLHRAHRPRALGNAPQGTRRRESLFHGRARAVGRAPERTRNVRRHDDHRLLGQGARASAARPGRHHCRARSCRPGGAAAYLPGTRTSRVRELTMADKNLSNVNPLTIARNALLAPSGLDEGRLTNVLGTLMGSQIDVADLYFQLSREESWSLEDGIVKDGAHSIEQGVGV